MPAPAARVALLLLTAGLLLPSACSGPFSRDYQPRPLIPLEQGEYHGPPPEIIGDAGPASDVVGRLARVFYVRLTSRRFNSLSTFHDPALRELFQTSEAFADYYAALADALTVAHFEALRPERVTLERVEVLEPDVVLVTARFAGQNSLPLRWWSVELQRVDRWEQSSGRWWLIPGKL